MRKKVTTTTPTRPGAAAPRRRAIRRTNGRRALTLTGRVVGEAGLARPLPPPSRSALGQLAEVQLDVEPVLVARDVLLHGHVQVELDIRKAGNVAHGDLLHLPNLVGVLLLVRLEARRVDPLVHLRIDVGADIEGGVLAVVVPE